MSQHVSLKVASVGKKHRNVLKRYERIKRLQETEKWADRKSVYGLPKIKSMKIKVRKAKSEKADAAEGAAAGTAATPAPAAPAAKAKAAPAK